MRVLLSFGWILAAVPASAQSSATLTGTVVDITGAVLSGAKIELVSTGTSTRRQVQSADDGNFVLPTLPPGRYILRASLQGFTASEMRDVVLNVGDRVSVRVELGPLAVTEGVTVFAEGRRVGTSPAVSTVIDRRFVANLPLNGRSFQSLLELTPGVVLTRAGHAAQEGGQFSVNGQRTNANYWMVDGVSANAGISGGVSTNPGQSGSGQLPAMTALGGTNGLVSVDALQEFRIHTSTYSPEFGRTPGAQISLVTRSGTNEFHGSLFEYFRDDALDATDWFANRLGQPKAKLEQHNYGGVLGGPILRQRVFFFGSFEALRLQQPRAVSISVPSLELRQSAAAAARPYLDVFPFPNGPVVSAGFATHDASYSDPSKFDSASLRLDHSATDRLTFFGRINYAPSYSEVRSPALSSTTTRHQDMTSVTAGSTWLVSGRLVHDLRVNYSTSDAPVITTPDNFGGAVPLPTSVFEPGRNPENALFLMIFGTTSWNWGNAGAFQQRQINIVDSLTVTSALHELKFGLDYRRINPRFSGGETPVGSQSLSLNQAGVPLGIVSLYQNTARTTGTRRAAFDNLSLYAQDNWRLTRRATVTYGIRWELVPPPHATVGGDAMTLENLNDPYGGRVGLAPQGTELYSTRYHNVAPRVGVSYVVSDAPGEQLIVRGGFGTFHDLSYGQVANSFYGYPFVSLKRVNGPALPLTPDVVASLPPGASAPTLMYVVDRDIDLPRTYQWNVSVERALGTYQTFTVGFIGAEGRKLLKNDRYTIPLADSPTVRTSLSVNRNRGYSDYRALQMQFQRRLQRGFQALASYTLGRSRDTASGDFATNVPAELLPPEVDYGFSDYDVRHVLSGALTYQTPPSPGGSLWRGLAGDWGMDFMVRARSGYPVNVAVNIPFPPDTQSVRPNVVAGQPFWIDDVSAPGGRRLNREAFTIPAPSTQGDLRRGSIRGFSASQVDLALRREIRLHESVRLQLRFELFNLLNTPNFADPDSTLASSTFGLSRDSLNRALGGLNALYQIGGPRSTQLAVKVLF